MSDDGFNINHIDNYLHVMANWRRLTFPTVPMKVFAGACDVAEGLKAELDRLRAQIGERPAVGYCANCVERCEGQHGPCFSEEVGCTEDFQPDDVSER